MSDAKSFSTTSVTFHAYFFIDSSYNLKRTVATTLGYAYLVFSNYGNTITYRKDEIIKDIYDLYDGYTFTMIKKINSKNFILKKEK